MENRNVKNVMIIDGAMNCAYDIFQLPSDEFQVIFPGEGQDIQFIEDLIYDKNLEEILHKLWLNPIAKPNIVGIHGTLYFGMHDKKKFFPNKRDSDLDFKGRAFSVASLLSASPRYI